MKQVLVFPRGQLFPKDKEKLTKLGIVAIEADDPSKVVQMVPGLPPIASNDLLTVAVKVLANWTNDYKRTAASDFVAEMAKLLTASQSR